MEESVLVAGCVLIIIPTGTHVWRNWGKKDLSKMKLVMFFMAAAVAVTISANMMQEEEPFDPYQILGVGDFGGRFPRGKGAREVKRAWRRVARTTHPDKGGDVEQFKLAELAHLTLTDESAFQNFIAFGHPHGRTRFAFATPKNSILIVFGFSAFYVIYYLIALVDAAAKRRAKVKAFATSVVKAFFQARKASRSADEGEGARTEEDIFAGRLAMALADPSLEDIAPGWCDTDNVDIVETEGCRALPSERAQKVFSLLTRNFESSDKLPGFAFAVLSLAQQAALKLGPVDNIHSIARNSALMLCSKCAREEKKVDLMSIGKVSWSSGVEGQDKIFVGDEVMCRLELNINPASVKATTFKPSFPADVLRELLKDANHEDEKWLITASFGTEWDTVDLGNNRIPRFCAGTAMLSISPAERRRGKTESLSVKIVSPDTAGEHKVFIRATCCSRSDAKPVVRRSTCIVNIYSDDTASWDSEDDDDDDFS